MFVPAIKYTEKTLFLFIQLGMDDAYWKSQFLEFWLVFFHRNLIEVLLFVIQRLRMHVWATLMMSSSLKIMLFVLSSIIVCPSIILSPLTLGILFPTSVWSFVDYSVRSLSLPCGVVPIAKGSMPFFVDWIQTDVQLAIPVGNVRKVSLLSLVRFHRERGFGFLVSVGHQGTGIL